MQERKYGEGGGEEREGRRSRERKMERKEEGCTNKNQGLLKWRRVRQIKLSMYVDDVGRVAVSAPWGW